MINDRGFDKQFAFMVLLNDTLGQSQSQTPTTTLGCEAGLENRLEFASGNALARIGNVNMHVMQLLYDVNNDDAFPVHGIHSVFANILYHPFEQIPVERQNNAFFRLVEFDIDL